MDLLTKLENGSLKAYNPSKMSKMLATDEEVNKTS